ncbi:MAG: protogloblin ApPgb [Hydrococcus sp. C42_A2020_068]|uniref:protoglobin domain-containing protein n=1 Tax=Pleurocapsa sp. PCC 7327 TaxID=118163 RepID=UPI00029FFDD6|nr:protoglobin domain-containing protein [Pleurocapsa sp. PCC 7327]AFY77222.1 Protoglobin [Pleurocapsa sp. PCC 7327]MBF2022663.1 protogloblin ApPgb [Hydrococcus sp. C42_A2020_068]
MTTAAIPGYTYGTETVAKSPISMEDFELIKKTVLFTEEDEKYLHLAGEVLQDQVEDVLDVWYSFVGSHPHLIRYFSTPDGKLIEEYLMAVRKRFGQWILDTCQRPYDRDWLNYQQEIGLRHTQEKKGQTDHVQSVPHIGLRYMIAFIYPITATIKPFLAKKGNSSEEVEKMYQAWFKSIVLQVTLWSYPYAKQGYF